MTPSSAKALRLKGAVASVVATAAALAACSLGLQSEDSYFSRLDASLGDDVAVVPREGAAPMEGPDAPEAAQRIADATSVVESGANADAAEGGNDAGVEAGFDAASLEPAVLQVYYPFEDEAGATVVADKSGNHLDAVLMGGADGGFAPPVFDPLGHLGHGLKLDGTQQQYAALPSRVVAGFDSLSVSCWISLQTAAVWNRLFDFNNGSSVWIYFSPTGWNTTTMLPGTHFAISSGAHLDPEMQLTETIPADATWHHVAVVLDRPFFAYYLDGVQKYVMTDMTLTPDDLNATQNWLGRSAYPADPYLTATIDEFRLYSGALTAAQVVQLANQ
jgi:hypothetical protein